jgi:16S rRNA (cytosine967-C5)-methyltransferase
VKDAPDWAARLKATLLPTGSLRLPAGSARVEALEGYAEGTWWVQDAAAALPVRLFGPLEGRTVVEFGAAPGGKTAQLAAAGARVIALDRSPARLGRLRANLERLRLGAELVEADARDWAPPAPADAVLIDAPCSATGTIRRHPEVARVRDAADLPRLCALQDALIAAGLRCVGPGGIVVFATCSLLPEEGERRIEAALAAHPAAERVPVGPEEIGGLAEPITAAGDLRTLPCHLAPLGGLDGFFAARLRLRV